DVGVVGDDTHVLDRHVVPLIDELREARLVALPLRRRADHDIDPAVSPYGHFGALARHPGRRIDIVGDRDAAMFAASAGGDAARREAVPIAGLQRPIHGVMIGAAVIDHAERIPIGELAFLHQITPPDLDTVEAVLAAGQIDQPFHHVHDFGAAGAAI